LTRAASSGDRGLLRRITGSDVAGSWVLVVAVALALVWANGPWSSSYDATWLHPVHVGGRAFQDFTTVRAWVNGGLMAVFFLVVGLEIGRERRQGDLADVRTAVVPVAGALGGMVGAGLVYVAVAHGTPGASGWGIPMATDIAFALGALALLGRRVPSGLRVFLLTLAVADDIGSIAVLAVFYSARTYPPALLAAGVVAVALVTLRRSGRMWTPLALAGGVVLWVLLAAGGVEPALAGVAAGLLVPGALSGSRHRDVEGTTVDPAARLEEQVAPWSAFVVLPLFAVANAGITFHSGILGPPGATAIFVGVGLARVLGQLAGITLVCLVVVRSGLGRLPLGVRWRHLAGGAAVAGIGFTVPLLIAELAFPHDPPLVTAAELGLFAGSAAAFAVGAAILIWAGPEEQEQSDGNVPLREGDGGARIPW
jgi:NhaA family Na+:H+ antiporter